MAGGLITDYLSQGVAASRPAAPDAASGTLSFYFATDTETLSFYDWNDAAWQDISTGGSFTTASTTEVLTGTDNAKGVTPDALAALWEKGADIASAGTISVGEGGFFHVTGTTTITDIDFGTDKTGRTVTLVFDGVLTLTHHATTLILPGGVNITTAAGDVAVFVSEGSDAVRCVSYQVASSSSGTSFPGGPGTGDIYYRTDRNIEYVYDGTRWLSTQIFTLAFPEMNAVAASTNVYAPVPWIDTYDIWLVNWSHFRRRSAAGEWDLALYSGVTNGTLTSLDTVDGSADVTADFIGATRTLGAVLDSSATFLRLTGTEVSGTAVFYLAAHIHYRLIG